MSVLEAHVPDTWVLGLSGEQWHTVSSPSRGAEEALPYAAGYIVEPASPERLMQQRLGCEALGILIPGRKGVKNQPQKSQQHVEGDCT